MSRFYLSKGRYSAPQYSRYAMYIKNRTIDGLDRAAINSHNQDLPETHGTYAALIFHPNWKAKRKEILERDGFKCVVCKSSKELQVHHRQYHYILALRQFKAPWDYPENLLITLCSKCHARGHAKYKVPSIKI